MSKESLENDPAERYIREFIYQKGLPKEEYGYRDVARSIHILPATLQQVMDMRNRAGRDTITALFNYYPDFDLVMAMTGKPGNLTKGPDDRVGTTPTVDSHGKDIEIVRLTTENIGLKEHVKILTAQNERVWRIALPKEVEQELNFLRSGSHITAVEVMDNAHERARIGYEYAKHLKSVDDEVQELIDQTLVIPIDSFDNVTPLWKQVEEKTA